MSWKTSQRGFIRWKGLGRPAEQVMLRPVADSDRTSALADTAEIPDSHPAYVLARLWVPEELRGQGIGKSLLYRASRQLVELHGQTWFGLMTDNYRLPAGRTRHDIRASWDSFVAEHPGATVENGFLLLTPDLDLED